MKHPPVHAFEFTPDTLRDWCAQRGMPAFKAGQILEWLYVHGVSDPAAMTNLSVRERAVLAGELAFLSGETVKQSVATDGTTKQLVQWTDYGAPGESEAGEPVEAPMPALPMLDAPSPETSDSTRQTECVMIPVFQGEDDESEGPGRAKPPHPGAIIDRATACISSQVGCPVGCRFCASGLGGLDGNLSAGRIIEQVWRLDRYLKASAYRGPVRLDGSHVPPRVTNVVFMGMGEPLSNFRAVLHAVRTLAAPWGMGISARRITISTVGLPRAIERLADELELPVTLALSLHAPNDAIRRELIPWAEYTSIAELLAACDKWFQKTGREITLEYTLLRGVNDRPEHAEELARVAMRLRANINLIRYNEVAGLAFGRPRTEDVRAFQEILRARGLNAHIRRSRGRDIAAACGQLRHETAGST